MKLIVADISRFLFMIMLALRTKTNIRVMLLSLAKTFYHQEFNFKWFDMEISRAHHNNV